MYTLPGDLLLGMDMEMHIFKRISKLEVQGNALKLVGSTPAVWFRMLYGLYKFRYKHEMHVFKGFSSSKYKERLWNWLDQPPLYDSYMLYGVLYF